MTGMENNQGHTRSKRVLLSKSIIFQEVKGLVRFSYQSIAQCPVFNLLISAKYQSIALCLIA